MDKDTQNRYLEILELPPGSSWLEIARSYRSLKQLYSAPSIAVLPVEDELTELRREEIIRQIDQAYGELENLYASSRKNLEKNIKAIEQEIDFFNGLALKAVRKRLNIELRDIATETNIPLSHLKKIENEEYGALPLEIYVIGYLKNYARCLSLDPKRVVADYMKGYRRQVKKASGAHGQGGTR